jgi:pyruvate formate lyase activating enzyme
VADGVTRVACGICPHGCVFTTESPVGRCRVRGLHNPGYGMCAGLAVDPIEKKPLHRFAPGTRVLSTGPNGCNLTCLHCQNWHISQSASNAVRFIPPRQLAEEAMARSSGIAFTYTEPVIWYEYIMDTAPLVGSLGGYSVMVSNGYVNPGPLRELIRVTDAWNVDLKAFTEDFYRDVCGGDLETVKNSIAILADSRCHLELTWLLIPGLNDSMEEITRAARWIAETAGRSTPLHVSRYFPVYRMDVPATTMENLRRAVSVFERYLTDVIPGNV